jgi:hypothetical protein
MKIKFLLSCAAVLLVLTTPAWAVDVTGKWVAEREGRQGPMEITFNFQVDGEKLTGTMGMGQFGETPISEGKVEGDEISFVIVRTFGDNEMRILYKGKVAGDEITFTTERQGGSMGGPPGGGPGGGMGGPPGGGAGGEQGGPRGPREPLVAKRVQ